MANISNVSVKSGNVLSLSGSSVQITGSVSASGDLYLGGKLTAREYYTQIVTSSVIYESGSTKFGDTQDDTHQFTGSVNITGAVNVIGIVSASSFTGDGAGLTGLSLGGSAVTSLTAGSNLSASASTGAVTVALTSSITSGVTTLTGVTNIGATTGSFVIVSGNGAGLTNLTATNLTGVVSLANGGTGKDLSSSISSGKLLIGSGSELVVGDLLPGNGIGITPNSGSVTIAYTGTVGVTQVTNDGDTNLNITTNGSVVTASLNTTLTGLSSVTSDTVIVNTSAVLSGEVRLSVTLVTASYNVANTDSILMVENTGSMTITLPSEVSNGRLLVVKKKTNSVETVTIDGIAVDGESTFDLNGPYQSVTLVSYGNEWYIT